jgi:hypothetical protein
MSALVPPPRSRLPLDKIRDQVLAFSCALSLAAPAPDHTQRAWLQSAGSTNGGPLMGRGDFTHALEN